MAAIDTGRGWIEPEVNVLSGDRRRKPRYELELPVRYKVLNQEGAPEGYGITRNLSSGGVAFETPHELPCGTELELSVQWPVALEGGIPLKLVIRGRIAWSAAGVAALHAKSCHFRTQSRVSSAGRPLL